MQFIVPNILNHPSLGGVSLGFCHGENKNEVTGDCNDPSKQYQNTIQQNIPINCSNHETYSGGSPYEDGWDAYNGILSAVWVQNNQQTNWGQQFFCDELGPIAWPSMAYVANSGIKTTNGLRHPSSIIHDNYIYLFYVEAGVYKGWTPIEEVRQGGVKVIRVQKDNALNANMYETYYKDPNGSVSWNPSLPTGFTKDNMPSYVAVKGTKSSDILNDNMATSDPVRFSVAKVRGTNHFIGIEEYKSWTNPAYYLSIRFSYNLVDWSARQTIYSAADWNNTQLHYPIFLDKTGWTNTEIDLDEFYIIGTVGTAQKFVNKIRLYKYIPPPPPDPCRNCPLEPLSINEDKNNVLSKANSSSDFNVQILPNPFSSTLSVLINIAKPTKTTVNLYSADGRFIKKLTTETLGSQTLKTFNLARYSPGLYFIEVQTGGNKVFKKIIKK